MVTTLAIFKKGLSKEFSEEEEEKEEDEQIDLLGSESRYAFNIVYQRVSRLSMKEWRRRAHSAGH